MWRVLAQQIGHPICEIKTIAPYTNHTDGEEDDEWA